MILPRGVYVIVSGAPGSGKTTLARGIAAELGAPLFTKDNIKEALLEVLGAASVEESRRIGQAAIEVLLVVAREAGGGVVESTWRPSLARADLTRLGGTIVEVFCSCDPALARERYRDRAPARAAGHFDAERLAAGDDLWTGETAEPIAGPWPLLNVDTTEAVHAADVARWVRRASAHRWKWDRPNV